MLPPLDKAASALKKGEISDVIESPVGYHIIKVEEVKEEKTRSLEEARAEILRELKTQRAKNEVGRAAEADREKALSGTAFSDLARARGVPFKVSSFITRFEALPEVGAVEEFNRVAFALGAKEVSPPVEGPNEYYLVRVKDRREPSIPAFEKVRADIERGLKETKGLEIADKKAGALLGQLKKEKDIHKLAKGQGLKVEETGWFLRRVTEIPKIGALRELRPGGIPVSSYQPIPDKIYTADGNLYLFAFKESQAADMERFEKEKANLQEQMLAEKRQRTLQKFVESLKAKARIKVRTRALEES